MAEKQNRNKRNKRAWLYSLKKDMVCQTCGETHVACLSFHHRDPTTKFKSIPQMCSEGYSRERIAEEMEKCDVLCANCHLKLHYAQSIYFGE